MPSYTTRHDYSTAAKAPTMEMRSVSNTAVAPTLSSNLVETKLVGMDNSNNGATTYTKMWAAAAPTVNTDAPTYMFPCALNSVGFVYFVKGGSGIAGANCAVATSSTPKCGNTAGSATQTAPGATLSIDWSMKLT